MDKRKKSEFLTSKNILRDKIRITIFDGSISITTNRNGNWMDKETPLEFKSSAIRKNEITHMFVGVSQGEKGNMKVTASKYV